MSNQHSGDLTAAIMAAAKSPTGLRTDSLQGYSTHQVSKAACKLCDEGKLHRAKISHKVVRYFDTEAAAKALTTVTPTVSIRKRLVPHSAWSDLAPAIIPKDLPIIECPSPPQHRYETKECDYKPFSSLKPGQYVAPASKWVEAVGA